MRRASVPTPLSRCGSAKATTHCGAELRTGRTHSSVCTWVWVFPIVGTKNTAGRRPACLFRQGLRLCLCLPAARDRPSAIGRTWARGALPPECEAIPAYLEQHPDLQYPTLGLPARDPEPTRNHEPLNAVIFDWDGTVRIQPTHEQAIKLACTGRWLPNQSARERPGSSACPLESALDRVSHAQRRTNARIPARNRHQFAAVIPISSCFRRHDLFTDLRGVRCRSAVDPGKS